MEFIENIFNGTKEMIISAISSLNGASGWLVISFLIAGILHNILSADKFQTHIGNKKISSIVKVTISGMFLPICSCGVIPIGISLYYSGAYLGPVLAFMTATPIINPIAVILCLGLLGTKITIIYVVSGFLIPFIVGLVGNIFGGEELFLKKDSLEEEEFISLEEESVDLSEKIKSGIKWAFEDLAVTVSKYVVIGMLCAGFITTIFPSSIIQKYLGSPNMISLGSIAVLACIMYVCAIGHIPFIAALVASGAAPGMAITFLIAGVATNLPELINISKVIGKRAAFIYSFTLVTLSIVVGYITNILVPVSKFNIDSANIDGSIKLANFMLLNIPPWFSYICSFIIIGFASKSIFLKFREVTLR
ncbi:MAG: efflux transporter SaoE [Filifactoraceae bacterium]